MTILVLSILLAGSVLFNIRHCFHSYFLEEFTTFLTGKFCPDLTDEEIDKLVEQFGEGLKARWYNRFGIKR
jgi:hypothetical protein